jgi:hypothetical protein
LVADALVAAKAAGAGGRDGTGLVILRVDSAFYNHDVICAARRAKVRFSITARMSPALTRAISAISDDAWTPITYPNAVWDDDEQRLISDAHQLAAAGTRRANNLWMCSNATSTRQLGVSASHKADQPRVAHALRKSGRSASLICL